VSNKDQPRAAVAVASGLLGWPLDNKRNTIDHMTHWEIIADNLSKAGWSWGYVSAVDSHGRTIWIADAHRDGKRFVLRADEKADCVSGT
jgi:hypothetical protein